MTSPSLAPILTASILADVHVRLQELTQFNETANEPIPYRLATDAEREACEFNARQAEADRDDDMREWARGAREMRGERDE